MKLPEHVNKLRILIDGAFDKHFARLGISKTKKTEAEKLPEELRPRRQRFELMLDNHIGETGDYESAREKLIDELTFTLFNRFAAVKVMEAASLFPPVLTKQPEHGDRSFGHKAWLELHPDMRSEELEGIREYIKHAFNELGETLPLYSKSYPYALLPDAISLNDIIDAFNEVEKDAQTGKDIWQSDDVLGWMYESYNNAKKEAFKLKQKEEKAKVEYNKVSLQSQVYTPRWVVQFLVENSLGKLYLEMYPDSEIKHRYKIANAPMTQIRTPKPLHEIKLIDPSCGSGNFLMYAFDFFYALYLDQTENYGADYNEAEIPRLIIEQNLHGIDLDDRAVQLAQLGLFIKARKKRRTIGELKFKVVSSDFFLPEYEVVREIFESRMNFNQHKLDQNQKDLIEDIWGDLRYAYKFGSLIRLDEKLKAKFQSLIQQRGIEQQSLFTDEEMGVVHKPVQHDLFTEHDIEKEQKFSVAFLEKLKIAVEQYARAEKNTFLTSKTRDAITFLELLTSKYDVAAANPPYTDGGDFGPELKEFIEDNYKKPYNFHTNLYATFIKRCYDLIDAEGKIAIIHPRTFMFIKTFEDVRKFIIDKTHINVFIDYSLSNLFGTIMVDPAFYVLEKTTSLDQGSWFVSLDQYTRTPNEKFKKDFCLQALDDYVAGVDNANNYIIPQSKLKIIKSWPFIYWISDEFREKFKHVSIENVAVATEGFKSNNNNKILRFFWELFESQKLRSDCRFYTKGGKYNKWYGNNWMAIVWKNNGLNQVQNGASLASKDYYFQEGLTYTKASVKGNSFRMLEKNMIFDSSAPGFFVHDKSISLLYMLSLMNSYLIKYLLTCFNPTAASQVRDIERLPFVKPAKQNEIEISIITENTVLIKKHLCEFKIIEMNYKVSPITFISGFSDLKSKLKSFFNYENHLLSQVLINESIINKIIFEVYDLNSQDKAMVLAKEGESIGGMPVSVEARAGYLADIEATVEFPLDNILDFINSLPVQEFTAEERESIEREFPALYQSNNDLEEFCIRHKVNPINVWYWFKESNVIPTQRMHTLALEFLADMIREILMEDDDGIIPLVPNAGEKVLLDRIEEKFREKGFSMAQYSSFDSVLGRPINEYLNKYFFAELSDHLNLFMYLPKTPFIWHLSSGPEQGFDCYIIIYKWSRDKLMRLRSVYIEHRERSLTNRQSDLSGNSSADAQNEKDRIFKQLKEIEAFKAKIDELLSEGYDPILDDGVGKNIAPLQKKKMIPYEVLNAGQLKTYLNADW